jgi:hypothetical protein
MARWLMQFMLMRRDGEAAAVMVWCHGTPWCCHDDDSLSFWEKWTTRDDVVQHRPVRFFPCDQISLRSHWDLLRFSPAISTSLAEDYTCKSGKQWLLTFCMLRVKVMQMVVVLLQYVCCRLPGYRWSYCLLFLRLKSLLYNWVEKRWIFKA